MYLVGGARKTIDYLQYLSTLFAQVQQVQIVRLPQGQVIAHPLRPLYGLVVHKSRIMSAMLLPGPVEVHQANSSPLPMGATSSSMFHRVPLLLLAVIVALDDRTDQNVAWAQVSVDKVMRM